jgi:hypothetical protein
MLSLIERLRAVKACEDEMSECYLDSGPYCGAHDHADQYVPLLREAADALEQLTAEAVANG